MPIKFTVLWRKYSKAVTAVATLCTALGAIYVFVDQAAAVTAKMNNNASQIGINTKALANLDKRSDKMDIEITKHLSSETIQTQQIKDSLCMLKEIAADNKRRIDSLDTQMIKAQVTLDYIKAELSEVKEDVKAALKNTKVAKN